MNSKPLDLKSLDFKPLLIQQEEEILIVTIHRPEAMNALNEAVLNSFEKLLNWITETHSPNQNAARGQNIRAVVVTGSGEKAFVAGADIKQFEDMHEGSAQAFAARGQKLFSNLENLPFPVIAAVNGFALGGGLELALACDFIYASENAKFSLPECSLGLMPGFGGTVRLPRKVGTARALEMAMTGGMILANEALAYGLVNKVVPLPDLLKTAIETAKICGTRAPLALERIKKSIHEGMNRTENVANELEAKMFGELFVTDDKKEGVRAFIEKRKPSFKGK